jgi:signal peptidase I
MRPLLLAGAVAFTAYAGTRYRCYWVGSASMEPTLHGPVSFGGSRKPDRFLVDLQTGRFGEPRRGEVWVFHAPKAASPSEGIYVMRVLGVPGDTIEVIPPRLQVDGRTALVLANYGFPRCVFYQGIQPVSISPDRGIARVTDPVYYQDLVVVAHPHPRIRESGDRIVLKGVFQRAAAGHSIERIKGLARFGRAPGVAGVMYHAGGCPWLTIVQGNRLDFDPGHLLVNGERLVEPYLLEPPLYGMSSRRMGRNEYAVFGDYRNNSNDSHIWGSLERDRFVGRAVYRYWPPSRIGGL